MSEGKNSLYPYDQPLEGGDYRPEEDDEPAFLPIGGLAGPMGLLNPIFPPWPGPARVEKEEDPNP